jgi:hypothetical protein
MENLTKKNVKPESVGSNFYNRDLPDFFKPVTFKQGQKQFKTIEELDSEKNGIFTGLESNSEEKKILGGNVRPYLTQKEIILNEVLANIKKDDEIEIIKVIESEKDEEKLDQEDLKESEKDENAKEEEVSGLNPKTEILTEKDPDEIIILPNEELKKSLNKKNRNQPL